MRLFLFILIALIFFLPKTTYALSCAPSNPIKLFQGVFQENIFTDFSSHDVVFTGKVTKVEIDDTTDYSSQSEFSEIIGFLRTHEAIATIEVAKVYKGNVGRIVQVDSTIPPLSGNSGKSSLFEGDSYLFFATLNENGILDIGVSGCTGIPTKPLAVAGPDLVILDLIARPYQTTIGNIYFWIALGLLISVSIYYKKRRLKSKRNKKSKN